MTDSNATDLLPRPFCGGEARLIRSAPDWYFPACMNRECACDWTDSYPTKAEAIAAWNTRADDYKQAAEYWQRMYEEAFAERTCKCVNVNGYAFRFECSACGYVAIVHNCDIRLDELPNYCPNCGARVIT